MARKSLREGGGGGGGGRRDRSYSRLGLPFISVTKKVRENPKKLDKSINRGRAKNWNESENYIPKVEKMTKSRKSRKKSPKVGKK